MLLTCIAIIFVILIFNEAQAGSAYVTNSISSAPVTAGDFSNPISPTHKNDEKDLNISVYGSSWVATVILQRKFSDDATWYDVDSWTANTEKKLVDTENGTAYRIGVKQGGYTSGSVSVRLSK